MITTRLCKDLTLKHPIISAPMAMAAGGELASAVSRAGGLGLIGGGYGDAAWIEEEFKKAGNARIGIGFITWKLHDNPALLDLALAHKPSVLFLSFHNPAPFAGRIHAANIPLVCQVQSLRDAKAATDAGAIAIVAQGSEAGGHGEKRGTLPLVPEIADWLANNAPQVLLLAAGGIADGRGLAASLMLGADGVMIGSRFWASKECLVSQAMTDKAIAATGDETIRSSVMDQARSLNWPQRYTARVLRNPVTERWHNNPEGLKANAQDIAADWKDGWAAGDPERSNTFVGEVTGLIKDRPPVADIITRIIGEAESLLNTASGFLTR